jgi:hypothetical protein
MKITEKKLRQLIREEIERLIDEADIDELDAPRKAPPKNVQGQAADAEKLASAFEQLQSYINDKWAPTAKSLGRRVGNKNLIVFADKLSSVVQAAPVIRQA